jgi:hypothetical protein
MWLRQSNLGVRIQDDYGGDYHSDAMEHIYAQVGTFKPSKERYRSASPVGASGVAITKGVAAIGTGAVPKTRAAVGKAMESNEPSVVDRQRSLTWALRLKRVFAIRNQPSRYQQACEAGCLSSCTRAAASSC